MGYIDTFATLQAAVLLDFVAFLVPIIYVLNVHRLTFKTDASITSSFAQKRTTSDSSPSINSKSDVTSPANYRGLEQFEFHNGAPLIATPTERSDTQGHSMINTDRKNSNSYQFLNTVPTLPDVLEMPEDEFDETMQGY